MKPVSPELIQKYLRGDCSAEEEAVVLNWYASFENNADPYIELSAMEQQELKQRMFINIEAGTDLRPRLERSARISKVRIGIYLTGIAATIIFFVSMSLLLIRPKADQYSVATSTDGEMIINNLTNTISKQTLPDKSIVWLSPNAQIRFHKPFTKQLREIKLSGESFFEVTKDKAHPFIIYSDHIVTKVWGTSFRVKDEKNSDKAEVAVITGKVSVAISANYRNNAWFGNSTGGKNDVMLLPKQQVSFENGRKELKVKEIENASPVNMWRKADLSFENVPLHKVIEVLNKQYNVEIILQDNNLNNYLLQADFTNQSLPDVMEILKKLLKLNYVIDGKKFTLQKV